MSDTLGFALDNTNLTWTTGGNANWFAQFSVYYNGGDAAQSGAIGNGQSSWIQTTVIGPGTVSFYWKVSSEYNCDFLRFYVNSVQKNVISGEVAWSKVSYIISAYGTYTLKWTYSKDNSIARGSDAGWLDKVVYTPYFNYCFDGYAKEGTDYVTREVALYRRSTKELVDKTTSSGIDGFRLLSPYDDEHFIVCLDDDTDESYNALIYDRVVGKPLFE